MEVRKKEKVDSCDANVRAAYIAVTPKPVLFSLFIVGRGGLMEGVLVVMIIIKICYVFVGAIGRLCACVLFFCRGRPGPCSSFRKK